MKDDQLATRWRALHDGFKDFFRKLNKLLVNRQTWRFVTALFRILMWIIRLLQQFM